MEFLLRYNNNDKNELITAAEEKESINVLLNYLDKAGIALVDFVPPDKAGLFCVFEQVAYRVYQSVYDKEDNRFNSYLIYNRLNLFPRNKFNNINRKFEIKTYHTIF